MVALARRRFLFPLQVGFLLVTGAYLLLKYDQMRTTLPSTVRLSQPPDAHAQEIAEATPTQDRYPAASSTTLEGAGLLAKPVATAPAGTWKLPSPVSKSKEGVLSAPGSVKESNDKKPGEDQSSSPTTTTSQTADPTPLANSGQLDKARSLVPSIMDPSNTSIDRMACPGGVNTERYLHLRADPSEKRIRYFFAVNLRQCVDLLPRLMGSLVEAIRFLGPKHCALSVVEGNSDDGTAEVLELLRKELDTLGVKYILTRSRLNPTKGDRIEKLSFLRAIALAPVSGAVDYGWEMFPNSEDRSELEPYERIGKDGAKLLSTGRGVVKMDLVDDATIVFLNDVAACAEDILELVHQRIFQEADMTCAMDWSHQSELPVFYDVWVSRAINGDTFFEIPANGSWDRAHDLFFNEPVARSRNAAHRPFQVFSCWNGAVAFTAKPVVDRRVLFRTVMKTECFQGEPQLFCKDLWWAGYGRIAVVPSVNLEYKDDLGRRTKEEKGYAHEYIGREGDDPEAPPLKIDWKGPPEQVKCMPGFNRQSWRPWNETLVSSRP